MLQKYIRDAAFWWTKNFTEQNGISANIYGYSEQTENQLRRACCHWEQNVVSPD